MSVLLNLVLSCTILTTFQLLIMSGIAPMGDQILTVKDVADYLKVNERTVYRMAASAKLPAFKVGASWRLRKPISRSGSKSSPTTATVIIDAAVGTTE